MYYTIALVAAADGIVWGMRTVTYTAMYTEVYNHGRFGGVVFFLTIETCSAQGSLLVTTYVLVAVACWYEDAGDGIGEGYIPHQPST